MFVRTEFSLREAFGPVAEVVNRLPQWGGIVADWGCWSHVDFVKECAKQEKKSVLGSRIRIIHELEDKSGQDVIIVPRNTDGLRAMYQAISLGYTQKYYVPRLMKHQLPADCEIISPSMVFSRAGANTGREVYASCDNFYPSVRDRRTWQIMLGRAARLRPGPMHITTEDELVAEGATDLQLARMRRLVEECDTPLPKAENIKFGVPDPDRELSDMCWFELGKRQLHRNEIYKARLTKELGLIAEKKFADYFLVISDMIKYAKQHMLVGPARGSSAGSLVCWLTRITEIDPLEHDLIFERFVDVNRMDLPDIDIDFPDTKRHMVMTYLEEKYTAANVAHIGTVIRYKPKSALTDVAKEIGVPLFELDKLKDVLIERSSGDARAGQCLQDSIDQLEVGKALVTKYPLLTEACRLEFHARSVGVHAAGIVVCNDAVRNYAPVVDGSIQADKKMAEKLNMLKIDALGLRTLSVVEEACALAGIDPFSMYKLPLDDQATLDVFNNRRYAGVFQFEGIALQSIANQIEFTEFEDIAAITALARPGPLSSGETSNWVLRKTGQQAITYHHPMIKRFAEHTYGCIIYQEQVMKITRELGNFSWADTGKIRKLMSESRGDESFGAYEKQFVLGAGQNGIEPADALRIWRAINTFGSWAFNRSHAVAYGLLSYWTAWLKAHHPMPLIVANLCNSKHDDATLTMLREAVNEGIEYIPFSPEKSQVNWSYDGNVLYGGLLCLPGIGAKTAMEIQNRKFNGMKLTNRQQKLLLGTSKFADPFPTRSRFGHMYDNPTEHLHNCSRINFTQDVDIGDPSFVYVVLGKLVKKNLLDINDTKYVTRRGGKRVPEDRRLMLIFHLEDDTGRILCCINGKHYLRLGKKITEEAAIGDWFAVRGVVTTDFKMLQVSAVKWL
jgi:DNA polymerase III alpha subunit